MDTEGHPPSACFECDGTSFKQITEHQSFNYRASGEDAVIEVDLPGWECVTCEARYLDSRAEELRHDAVCSHFGLLTPSEIRNLRRGLHLSQKEFAELGGFGEASIKRWETGATLQNSSIDRLLRLMADSANISKLHALSGARFAVGSTSVKPKFQTELPEETVSRAKRFRLRGLVTSEVDVCTL